MPDPAGQVFKPVIIPTLPPLSLDPPLLANFVPTGRLTRERLDSILQTVPADFLTPREIDLLAEVLRNRNQALAFEDAERGTFSDKYYPDYELPVIEHTPWVQEPIRIPKAIEETVRNMLKTQVAAKKYEPSTASYRSRLFAVSKKGSDKIRLIQDVQELNKVTVRDAGLPPRLDDFAEGFVGRVIYGLADLFAGYDGRRMAIKSRPMTTFSCMIGPLRSCALPQGATNSVPKFQRCSTHAIVEEIPNNGNVFIDDVGIMGPADWYDQREVVPQIRQAVYEYATVLDRFLVRFITAGITASGKKMVLATPKLNIVGTIVSHEGWHLEHGLASKIVKWPRPTSVTDVRSFLGTAGVGRKWIKNFALIAKPLTLLTRMTDSEFFFDDGAVDAMEALKDRVSAAPILVKIDYTMYSTRAASGSRPLIPPDSALPPPASVLPPPASVLVPPDSPFLHRRIPDSRLIVAPRAPHITIQFLQGKGSLDLFSLDLPLPASYVLPRASDDGLVVVAVDSCTNGAGWILQQISNREKRPALFGSVTFNEVESRYSQPKCELYGVFRAVKDLRHRIWGIHFRIDADAKFLTEMIKNPDLPNAPMTRWVSYLSLFDFTINHVPALSHKAADGLSRRKRSPDDSDDEDAEKYLDSFVNKSTYVHRVQRTIF
ncbi:putative transposition, RNA-mediated [Lyophyllum shimeji]|uniref:Transposition, RNA-mediated n=1 Tax=Lyophyllum shimeji TaxID=47721 RepID=A0A9P3UN21_LYOSH|nr:putative transposition, RNA-mediated [Lyophyllum shimeji]